MMYLLPACSGRRMVAGDAGPPDLQCNDHHHDYHHGDGFHGDGVQGNGVHGDDGPEDYDGDDDHDGH